MISLDAVLQMCLESILFLIIYMIMDYESINLFSWFIEKVKTFNKNLEYPMA